MENNSSLGAFTPLTSEEMMIADGQGPVTLCLSCIGIAVSPVVACLNLGIGAALATVSIGTFVENYKASEW